MNCALLIGTVETKKSEINEFSAALFRHGVSSKVIDISLGSCGRILSGREKINRMEEVILLRTRDIAEQVDKAAVAVGLGGGTGGEIALAILKTLPATYPKILISTMAFDPRDALADTAITLVPTLCDLEGLNPMLRQVFENTAAMVAGLTTAAPVPNTGRKNIALTTLGATGPAGTAITNALDVQGYDTTVFHSNGYGGAGLARFIAEGGAAGLIDLNVHELGRLRLAGAHVEMPTRFRAADNLPRVVLPGALNFLGLGTLATLIEPYRARPHYQHSGLFTHVQLTESEMEEQAAALAAELNYASAACHVILPMGGFSHQDRPGGAIEAPELRKIAADVLEAEARAYTVARIEHHINSEETAHVAVSCLLERMPYG